MRIILILIVIMILFSGCIEQLNELKLWLETWAKSAGKQFGFNVVKTQEKQVDLGATDVLVIKSVSIIPEPPILPKQWVFLMYTLQNLGKKPIDYVTVDLYDAPEFRNNLGKLCNLENACKPEVLLCAEGNPCKLNPREEKQVRFRLISPKVEEKTYATLSARIRYKYKTNTSYSFSVLNRHEIERRQREGKVLSITNEKIITDGPVFVDIYLVNTKYGIGGEDLIIALQVKERGSGDLVNTQIEHGDLIVFLPPELLKNGGENLKGTNVISVFKKGNEVCTNKKDVCIRGSIKVKDGSYCCTICPKSYWNTWQRTCVDYAKCEWGSGFPGKERFCENGLKCCVPKKNKLTGTRDYDIPYIYCENGICKNLGVIPLHEGMSAPIYLVFKNIPDVDIMKTVTIKATVRYTYELRHKFTVEVKPYGS